MIRPKRYAGTSYGGRLRRGSDKYGRRGIQDIIAGLFQLKTSDNRWNIKVIVSLVAAALFFLVVMLGARNAAMQTGGQLINNAAESQTRLGASEISVGDMHESSFVDDEEAEDASGDGDEDGDEVEDEVEGEDEGEIDLVLDGEAVDEGEEDPVDHEEEGDAEVHEEEEEGDEAMPPAQDTTPYVRGPATLPQYFQNYGRSSVNIDSSGHFKYVLVEATDHKNNKAILVQGCPAIHGHTCKHPDAFKALQQDLKAFGISSTFLGGGRISTKKSVKKLGTGFVKIFGYSKTFKKNNHGKKCTDCHVRACALIEAAMPKWQVRWSPSGYRAEDQSSIKKWYPCRER